MGLSQETGWDAGGFTGRTRLFPLPNLVLFPHILQPLHIFEPRYRDLMKEALAEDKLITMAILSPGWEKDYDGNPPVRDVACLGRITTHHRLEGGEYNLLLAGLRRVEIVQEFPSKKRFREAEVRLIEDAYPPENALDRPRLHMQLLEHFRLVLSQLKAPNEPLETLLSPEVNLGMLTDLMAYTLDLGVESKLRLLGEANVDLRARMLLRQLSAQQNLWPQNPDSHPTFPPEFSEN